MSALTLRDVRKVYPSGDTEIVALDHAELTVDDTELVALIGPSGSGKSTLLSIAGGLLTPSEGSVTVAGEDITAYSPKRLASFRRDHVGFVFQSLNLVPFLTAFENLTVVPELTGRRGAATRKRARILEIGAFGMASGRFLDQGGGGDLEGAAASQPHELDGFCRCALEFSPRALQNHLPGLAEKGGRIALKRAVGRMKDPLNARSGA